jgi:hypothetical protein
MIFKLPVFIALVLFSNLFAQPTGLEHAVSAWLFDEGYDAMAYNYINGCPDGSIVGEAEWVEGLYGTALEFDGIDDGVEIPTNPLKGAHALTIQAYIKPSSIPDFGSSKVFNIALVRAQEGFDRFMIDIIPSFIADGWVLSNFMSIEGNVIDPEDELKRSGAAHPYGEWYHVAVVIDSISPISVNIKHYVNHQFEHEWEYTLGFLNEGAVYIGERYQPKGDPPTRNYFHGIMDNVVLHDKALTTEEFLPKPEDISSVEPNLIYHPISFKLEQNYPNPFNPTTTIRYYLSAANKHPVSLQIFNLIGQRVATLVDGFQTGGNYKIVWNGKTNAGHNLSSGIYYYRLNVGPFKQIKSLVLLR